MGLGRVVGTSRVTFVGRGCELGVVVCHCYHGLVCCGHVERQHLGKQRGGRLVGVYGVKPLWGIFTFVGQVSGAIDAIGCFGVCPITGRKKGPTFTGTSPYFAFVGYVFIKCVVGSQWYFGCGPHRSAPGPKWWLALVLQLSIMLLGSASVST